MNATYNMAKIPAPDFIKVQIMLFAESFYFILSENTKRSKIFQNKTVYPVKLFSADWVLYPFMEEYLKTRYSLAKKLIL